MNLSAEQLCLSIDIRNFDKVKGMLSQIRLMELRCDSGAVDWEILSLLETCHVKTIITCREGKISEQEQLQIYIEAINQKVAYIDVDLDFQFFFQNRLHISAKEKKIKLIISHHNFKNTPNKTVLEQLLQQCYHSGADLAKIVVTPKTVNDIEKIVNLYSKGKPVIAFGMGSFGMITRLLSLYLGAPFAYASADLGMQTAQGQICYSDMMEIIRVLNLNVLLNAKL